MQSPSSHHFRYIDTQVRTSGESLRIMWPSSVLQLASPALRIQDTLLVPT